MDQTSVDTPAGTERVYQDDAYLSTMEARLRRIEGERGLVFDRTNFFATGGGQPGDTGHVEFSDGRTIPIVETAYSPDKRDVVMFAGPEADLPAASQRIRGSGGGPAGGPSAWTVIHVEGSVMEST